MCWHNSVGKEHSVSEVPLETALKMTNLGNSVVLCRIVILESRSQGVAMTRTHVTKCLHLREVNAQKMFVSM